MENETDSWTQDRKVCVLVVDDIPDNITLIQGVLGDLYVVKAATNGEQALKIAVGNNQPDLILLDIMMPGMDGFEVCRRLKEDDRTQAIPVIFVTAMVEDADEARGFALGAVDYITKPVSPALLLARVRTHLTLHDQSRLLEALVEQRTGELREEIGRREQAEAELLGRLCELEVLSGLVRLQLRSCSYEEACSSILDGFGRIFGIGQAVLCQEEDGCLRVLAALGQGRNAAPPVLAERLLRNGDASGREGREQALRLGLQGRILGLLWFQADTDPDAEVLRRFLEQAVLVLESARVRQEIEAGLIIPESFAV